MATIPLHRLVAAREALSRVYTGWLEGTVKLPDTTRRGVSRALGGLESELLKIGAMPVEVRCSEAEEPAA